MKYRAIHNITSLLAIAAIVIGSMAQFHHHLKNGSVCVVYGEFIASIINHNCPLHEHSDHENAPAPDNKSCSFKLSSFNVSDNNTSIFCKIIAEFPSSTWLQLVLRNILPIKRPYYISATTSPLIYGVLGFRAPPIF